MSLRVRLVAGLLAIAAVGLAILAAVTYTEQRSFLLDRADQQARAAAHAVSHVFDARQAGVGAVPGGPADGDRGPGGRPDGDEINLPPGTYGELRDPSGTVGDRVSLSYGQSTRLAPTVPADQAPGAYATIDGPADTRYRTLVEARPGGGTIAVAVPLADTDETLQRLLVVSGLVILGILVVLAIVSWWLVGLGLRPLEDIADTADDIAEGELEHRVETTDPRTEVGRLGLALNAMLDRLQDAFAAREESENRLRRFLADASHELRTPLASIRGYAELYRLGATPEPEKVARSMGRIEDEAARMGVLVEDMLTLARLDEMRAPARDDVDLRQLAADGLHDAEAVDPERRFTLTAPGAVPVLGDAGQLRQVLANLLRNAMVHTPPGTAIEVTVEAQAAGARLQVRDHGPGLPAGIDPDQLFERFWRADPGRVRGPGGAGLGLAIVAGIVHAHGGVVQAADAPGGGAVFSVLLPLAAAPTAPRAPAVV